MASIRCLTPRMHACHTSAPVLRRWEAAVKRQLDEGVRKGVSEPVPVREAEWCIRMMVIAKKLGQSQCTVDYHKLKCCLLRRDPPHTDIV